ncbi:MAG: DUF480 domain-containing protein [Woeseiaceae bacterium]|nr:DUF480 domain-containing protein [Woeseiaceae bacterium]
MSKYSQRLCNTRYSDYRFEPPELAIVCALLLRGPQTPGELRTHCRRLYEFADNRAVQESLEKLADYERGAIVQALPRSPGRRDVEYMHLFGGPVDVEAIAATRAPTTPSRARDDSTLADLERRVTQLEAVIEDLKVRLGD